jgi:plastocyanin
VTFPRLALSVALVLLALSATACGSSASQNPVATDQVKLPPSYLFSPAAITVKAGTTVTWTNSDNFTHSVRIPAENGKIIGVMHPGQRVTYTFSTPGTYHYDCSFHPTNMKGTVVVTSG